MRADFETHAMRMLIGLSGLGVLLLLAMVAQLIGTAGWLVLIVIAGGAAAVYILGVIVIAALDRLDR